MSLLRWLTRISWLEWLVIGGAVWLLLQRPRSHNLERSGPDWVINLCAFVTIGALIGAGITGERWLGLLGFGTAVLGLAIGIQRSWRRLKRWLTSFWRTEN